MWGKYGWLVHFQYNMRNTVNGYHIMNMTPGHTFSVRMLSKCVLSHVQLFATPWTAARQAPLSMGFSRQEYWSGLPFPSPGDLPDPGIEPESLASLAL